ncbi:hypothetical protein CDD81_4029 [Ophiocordyceps australis]|uniref:Rhodopsin domain-containing protein n=1 Tax=Ophiocordyceps australis TaxID=1399860 RepID=A0A2C5Y7T5_9HYPO|nr:hypothetical protein CDD81_4029 [Ophiocordyceps australis]
MKAIDLSGVNLGLSPQERDQAIERTNNTARITVGETRIAIWCLFGFAAITFSGRLFIRLATRRRLYVDDGFLIFAFVCLVVGTVLFHLRLEYLYVEVAVLRGNPDALAIALTELPEIIAQAKWQLCTFAMLWTSIFSTKLCYFAFFHSLIRATPNWFIWYFRISIVFTVVLWIVTVVGLQIIPCPYLGQEAAGKSLLMSTFCETWPNIEQEKCFPQLPVSHTTLTAISITLTAFDAVSDLIIVSIPIYLLQSSRMSILKKIGIGSFLCLSGFMLTCCIVRAAGGFDDGIVDYSWQSFWAQAEASVGVAMASITAYRATLVGSNDISDRLRARLYKIKRRTRNNAESSNSSPQHQSRTTSWLPRVPMGRMTGLGSLFGLRTCYTTTYQTQQLNSKSDIDEYHAFIRMPDAVHAKGNVRE